MSNSLYNTTAYKKPVEAAMKAFEDACNTLTALAAAHRIHPTHVIHMQTQIERRTKDLKVQLSFKHSEMDAFLPEVPDADAKA